MESIDEEAAAAQPIKGGVDPAIPPMTMFCGHFHMLDVIHGHANDVGNLLAAFAS